MFLFTCNYLQAQYENGSLVGTIRDASSAAVSGAAVTITNNATSVTAKTTTNDAGDYEIPSLRVGVYTVSASAQGFTDAVANNITVSATYRGANEYRPNYVPGQKVTQGRNNRQANTGYVNYVNLNAFVLPPIKDVNAPT